MINIFDLLGKTKNGKTISLIEHSTDVADTCFLEAKTIINNADVSDDYSMTAYITGLFHDIGKCVNVFQRRLRGENIEVLHNVLSYYFCYKYIDSIQIDHYDRKPAILASILYHHPTIHESLKDYSNKDIIPGLNTTLDMITDDDKKVALELIKHFQKMIENRFPREENEKYSRIFIRVKDDIDGCCDDDNISKPIYLEPGNPTTNDLSLRLFLTTILRNSDVLSSHYEYDGRKEGSLIEYIKNEQNRQCLDDITFDNIPESYDIERFNSQKEIAQRLISKDEPIKFFTADTGFGKTLTGLMFLLMGSKKKSYWICPINSIIESTYVSIKRELENFGLGDKVKVSRMKAGLIVDGDDKNPDIIITNPDSICYSLTKSGDSSKAKEGFQILSGNFIYDECHKYVEGESGLMSLFLNILKMRGLFCKNNDESRLLCMSATMEEYFFGVSGIKGNVYQETFTFEKMRERKINLKVGKYDVENYKGQNVLFIANAVKTTQNLFNEKCFDFIYHSNFYTEHRQKIAENFINTHKKGAEGNCSWITTHIASNAYDVSFNKVIMYITTPNDILQGLGRCDRYNNDKEIPTFMILPIDNNNLGKSEKAPLEFRTTYPQKECPWNFVTMAKNFYDFIMEKYKEQVVDDKLDIIITKGDLYTLRDEFYEVNKDKTNKMYGKIYEMSRNNLKKIQYTYVSKKDDDIIHISPNVNLRTTNPKIGDYFVTFGDNDTLYQIDDIHLKLDDFKEDLYKRECKRLQKKTGEKLNSIKEREFIAKKAKHSDTPINILPEDGMFYDEMIGVVDNRKQKI